MKDEFIEQIAERVQDTHYHQRDILLKDALSVESDAYKFMSSKPERYSIFNDHVFDCIFFQRRGLNIDRMLIVRELEEINADGWLYQELTLTAESLGLTVDLVSLTEQGLNDYRSRISEGEILSYSGHYSEVPMPLPIKFVEPKFFKHHSGLNRRFQKNRLCPACGVKMNRMASDQKSMKGKRIYVCTDSSEIGCDFKVVVPLV